MKGFKDSTKTVAGHQFNHPSGWFPGNPNYRRGGPVAHHGAMPPQVDPNMSEADNEGHSAVHREIPSTEELAEHGGKSPLMPGFKKGGETHKHFHVHHHHHDGKGGMKTKSKHYEKPAEKRAEGGSVHDETSVAKAEPDGDYGDYKKGGGIHINPKHKGKFTRAMGKKKGHLTDKDVNRGLHSKSGTVRKEANFARMARRHFKPLQAGGAVYAEGGSVTGDTRDRLAVGGPPMRRAQAMPGAINNAPTGMPRPGMPTPGRGIGAGRSLATRPVYGGRTFARGGRNPEGARRIAREEVSRHEATPAPRGHHGLGRMLRRG